eukprot:2749792-Karenia_brevis.AAC.1
MQEWKNLSEYQIQADITQCKSIKKKDRNARQDYVAMNYVQLEKMRKSMDASKDGLKVMANNDNIISIQQFDPPPSQIMCKTFDEHT